MAVSYTHLDVYKRQILPRVHGSGMFTRGQTQVLTICTLGSTKDAQIMDDLSDTCLLYTSDGSRCRCGASQRDLV